MTISSKQNALLSQFSILAYKGATFLAHPGKPSRWIGMGKRAVSAWKNSD